MRYKTLIGLGVSCLLLGQGIAWGQARGYRLRGDRLEVATSAHWRVWEAPAGMADISSVGSVTPVFISSPANAIENHGDFGYELPGNLEDDYDTTYRDGNVLMARGGIKKAGSRASLATRIMDGNPRTFWEPSSTDAVENWWVEIDLGRLVSATRIVVRFSEDSETDRADPFLQFKVHSATGQSPFGTRSSSLDFALVGGTTQPNEDQRLFEFDLDPLLKATDEWSGRLVQYVRISATASRGARAELMTAEGFVALAPDDRGSIDHFWAIAGEERLVSAERYAELPTQQQGGMRHYRRERPRLAEVEVWTVGDNISIGIVDRGGELRDPNPAASPRKAFDGRITTNWSAVVYSTVGDIAEWGVLTMDLGALFRVNAVRVITRLAGGAKTLFGYQLRGSDGSLAPDGTLVWDVLNSVDRQLNTSNTRLFEDRFPLRNVRFLEFRNLDVARATLAYKGNRITSTVTEMQIFAEGFLPELVLTSDLIDLQSTRTLTTIDWDADTPAGSAVELRTRSGNDLREINRYFKKDGTEVDETTYRTKVPSFQQGDITTEVLPGPGWSNWSQAYVAPGEIVRSPSPRRYTMIQATLLSRDPDAAATLRSIHLNLANPVSDNVVGEIEPKRRVPAGEVVDFDVYVRPRLSRQNSGFDRVRVIAPSGAVMRLEEVRRGAETNLRDGTADVFQGVGAVGLDEEFRNAAGRSLNVAGNGTDTLMVELPTRLRWSLDEFALPRLSGSPSSVVVESILVAAGDSLSSGQASLEVRDGSRALSVVSPISGWVGVIHVAEGDTIARGDLILETEPDQVQVSFRSIVFQSGSTFEVQIGNSSSPDQWQRVDPGEAVGDDLGEGRGLTVLTPLGDGNIKVYGVSPEVFTPNGDGINEVVVFEFAVLNINVEREVTLEVFDLAGRRVRQLTEIRTRSNGSYAIPWDGMDESGALVPPGTYLLKASVDSDSNSSGAVRVVGLVY